MTGRAEDAFRTQRRAGSDRVRLPHGGERPSGWGRQRATMRHHELVALVHAARSGDEQAWARLVAHFSAPIRSVARRHRLSAADQEDVVQHTWLRLVERIDSLREPAALPGWLVTTARREALNLLEGTGRELLAGDGRETADAAVEDVHDVVAAGERRGALRRAVDELPPRQRALMRLMMAHPALSYEQVGATLGLPVGSIGPTRGRSLSRLRRDPHLHASLKEET